MSLALGTHLGPYEVTALIGAGGMGEVYRATDTNLKREVAVKVLPESVASDAERLARFQREAEILARLNHPSIAHIYGLEQSDDGTALVMELVEGPTLADRIAAGPIPVEEALPIARRIAEALEAAHDLGIVHRDLKPANIKVQADGTVKVLDFGLAKAIAPAGAVPAGATTSPTITTPAMTQAGMILGTAAYMAPEQARGRPVDRRADVWAVGCVLYEMLTGRQAFPGDVVTEVLAAVLRAEPDWNALPKETTPAVETLLRRCLRKDPRQRLGDQSAARLELDDAIAGRGLVRRERPAPGPRLSAGIALAGAAAVAAVAAVLAWTLKPAPPPPVPARVLVALADGDQLDGGARNLALSPDGQTLAYVAVRDGVSRLYVRPLSAFEATRLKGTEGAFNPFFSPDGRWLGFFAQDKMKKISVDGGAAQTITDAGGLSPGASWGADGTIVYSPSIIGNAGLWRVSADGGTPSMITAPDGARGEYSHRYPQILPGGQAVLFTSVRGFGWDESNVEALVLATGERRVLVRGGETGRFVPGGHLLYCRAGSLLDVPFDPDRLDVGDAKPATIADGVGQNSGPQSAFYAVSSSGTVAYAAAAGGSRQFERQLVWIDRQGRRTPIGAPPRNYGDPAPSPSGRRVVVMIRSGTDALWLYDLDRESLTRLTSDQSSSITPVWSPDGRDIAYRSNATGRWQVYSQPADGSAPPDTPLTTSDDNDKPGSWSPDGRVLALVRNTDTTQSDIWMLPLDGDRKPYPFVQTPAAESEPKFSPDGRWLAYTSDESGGAQVYVAPYAGPGPRVQVSTDGGSLPQWNPEGGELFYRNGDRMMVVSVSTGTAFRAGRPAVLYQGPWGEVAADGQRFLATVNSVPTQPPRGINVMMNVLR